MPTKKIYITLFLVLGVAFLFDAFKPKEKDPLDKRVFICNVIEVKDGQNSKKSLPDEIEFKDGKIFSNVLNDKFAYKWIKYRINKDSAYVDSTETEIRYYEVEISHTDDQDQTMTMMCRIDEYDIDGDIKITKKDKLKKMFVFNGKEKYQKPKKGKEEKK
jgi:hypothetical protein